MIHAVSPDPPSQDYPDPKFIWNMVRTAFETDNLSYSTLADTYGIGIATIKRRSDKEQWVRDVVALSAEIEMKARDEAMKHREMRELVATRGYEQEVSDTVAVMEKTRERQANNNLANSNNMGIMIGQLAEFLSNVNVLDQEIDGQKICDTGAFVKLVSAVKNLNMDEKRPDVAVNVNNQVNIMDDIAGQHNSIYDDVSYNKDA